MSQSYTYVCRGRRPTTLFALCFMAALVAIGLTNDAPLVIWLIWVPCSAALLWLVLADPMTYVALSPECLQVTEGGAEQTISLDQIAEVEIREWTDSHDISVVRLSGERESLLLANPPQVQEFAAACEALGIPVARR